jgi:hypothetical protein
MDEIVRKLSKTSRADTKAQQQPVASGRQKKCGSDPHVKGAMREPAQTPDGQRGPLREVQEALEDLEKRKGDWSKGG